jgi:hypothetical protein
MNCTDFRLKISIFNDGELIRCIEPDNKRYCIYTWNAGSLLSPALEPNTIVFYISEDTVDLFFTAESVRNILNMFPDLKVLLLHKEFGDEVDKNNLKFFLPK